MLDENTLELRWPASQAEFHGYALPQEHLCGNRVRVPGFGVLAMFGGYSYLNLNGHPAIKEAAIAAITASGTGTHGVRMLAGTLELHHALETSIAQHMLTESSLIFSSGYIANVSTITALVDRGDVVICDKLNHASIIDGCRLAEATFVRYHHNDVKHLKKCLEKAVSAPRRLVIADSVFSMDGDVVDLPNIAALCEKHNAILMLDEAHGLGVLGDAGRGAEEHFGLPGCVDVKTGSLSKAIPSVGGYVAASHRLCDFFRQRSRGFVFSAALAPPAAAAALAAFGVLKTEPARLEQLRQNIRYFARGLSALDLPFQKHQTPIFPVICGTDEAAWELAGYCRQHGMYVQAIPYPVVPRGTARLRVSVTAAHTCDQMDSFVDVLGQGMRELGLFDRMCDPLLCEA